MKKIVTLFALGTATLFAATAESDAAYMDAVLQYNPIRYYQMEEATGISGDFTSLGTGTMADSSGLGADGSYVSAVNAGAGPHLDLPGGPAAGPGAGNASIQNASVSAMATFDGLSATPVPVGASSRTITMWFKHNGGTPNMFAYGTGNATNMVGLAAGPGALFADNGTNSFSVSGLVIGQWHFAALTIENDGINNADWTLYLDGASAFSDNVTTTTNADQFLIAGRWGAPSFNGAVDEVAIFDTALTADQINNIYTGTVIPEPASLALLGLGSLLIAGRRRNA